MITFEYTKPAEVVTVKVVSAEGKALAVGDIVENIKDGDAGVIKQIARAGELVSVPFMALGDMAIRTSHASTRVSNCYSEWRHLEPVRTTYWQRCEAWLAVPYDADYHDEYSRVSIDEACAIQGIVALLPPSQVDSDYFNYPCDIGEAIKLLQMHLTDITKEDAK